jgi:hypothetical protein
MFPATEPALQTCIGKAMHVENRIAMAIETSFSIIYRVEPTVDLSSSQVIFYRALISFIEGRWIVVRIFTHKAYESRHRPLVYTS